MTDRDTCIALNLVTGIGSTRLRRVLEALGPFERLRRASADELAGVDGIGPVLAGRMAEALRDDGGARHELLLARQAGAMVLTLDGAGYPEALRAISDPPLALYVRGALEASDAVAVAIVGSRHASRYGLACAEQLGYDLAARGVTVVSGLARGIDAAAHRGALKAGGRTIAVLGSGLNHLYPAEHDALARQIAQQGAVLSEYPMDMLPIAHNFPRRNRVISGLSLGVVVVEAAPRSGALITADCALEQGREVFAVPGPITAVTSQGTHRLLRQGARLAASVEDILEELRLVPQPGASELGGHESAVLACLRDDDAVSIDAVTARTGLNAADVAAALVHLELKHAVEQRPGKQFLRRAA